jgi:XTP/dITP diphosphohydrolase
MRLVLLATSPRVADGLLSASAWTALTAGPVVVAAAGSAPAALLTAAGVDVRVVTRDQPVAGVAHELLEIARAAGTATWWLGSAPDDELVHVVSELATGPGESSPVDIEVMSGSWDLPGAALLDVVAIMDRLRSPGGCPWDAEQDHVSLAPYLLEEAYEAFQAIEDGDPVGLREELGDVLLQVVFHARIAAERPPGTGWTIDDVAAGLVSKLIRRHPHVFDAVAVSGAAEVTANWEAIKTAERGSASPLANVPMAAPALTLAATLQRKAERTGLAPAGDQPPVALADTVQEFLADPRDDAAGDLLWAAVAEMRARGIDPEAVLRRRARQFRDDAGAEPSG